MTFGSKFAAETQHACSRRFMPSFRFSWNLILWGAVSLFSLAKPASGQGCPNLRGHWVSGSGGGVSMDISQTECKVSSDNMDSAIGFHHTVRGEWDSNQYSFSWNVARLDPHGCWTHLYGRATVTGPSTLNVDITSSEGRCGLPANFRG
jgi:hypothetical protein